MQRLLSFLCVTSLLCASANASFMLHQLGSDPAPSIETGGWDGDFLGLTDEVNGQQNQASFVNHVTGDYTQMSINFDFRISVGQGGGADGMGVAFVPISEFGTGTDLVALSAPAEEPNIAGALGVGFDTFNNGESDAESESSVSLHWDGALVQTFGLDASSLGVFENGEVHNAGITVTPGDGGSFVSVTISEVSEASQNSIVGVDNVFVDGLLPYDGRMVFNARTGGANSFQDIDNVLFTHVTTPNNPTTSVLYQFAVPEPSSFGLLAMAAGMLCFIRRRR